MKKSDSHLVNYYEFETEYILKSIQLYFGNILEFNRNFDVLVISSTNDTFEPINNSLVQSLVEIGLDLYELSNNPEIDLRPQFNAWMSKKINHPKLGFKRIICISFEHNTNNIESINKSLKSIFAILSFAQSFDDVDIRTITLPILGTGSNKIRIENIIEKLFEEVKKSLINLKPIKNIYIINRSERKISILDAVINRDLHRINSEINYVFWDQDCINMCADIKASTENLLSQKSKCREFCVLDDLLFNMNNYDLRFFQLAFLGRKTLEFLLCEKLENRICDDTVNLCKMISVYQKENNVSPWIINYMNIIRVIGNIQAHENFNKSYFPREINLEDQKIFMKCLARVLDYFVEINDL